MPVARARPIGYGYRLGMGGTDMKYRNLIALLAIVAFPCIYFNDYLPAWEKWIWYCFEALALFWYVCNFVIRHTKENPNNKWQIKWVRNAFFFFLLSLALALIVTSNDLSHELSRSQRLFGILALMVFNIFALPFILSYIWTSRDPALISQEEHVARFKTEKREREEKRRVDFEQYLIDLKRWFYNENKTFEGDLRHSISQMNTFWNYHEKQFIEGKLDHDQFRLALQYFLFPETKPQPPPPPPAPAKTDPTPPKDERPWWSPRKEPKRDRIDV
jgi:hypothetical protein